MGVGNTIAGIGDQTGLKVMRQLVSVTTDVVFGASYLHGVISFK